MGQTPEPAERHSAMVASGAIKRTRIVRETSSWLCALSSQLLGARTGLVVPVPDCEEGGLPALGVQFNGGGRHVEARWKVLRHRYAGGGSGMATTWGHPLGGRFPVPGLKA